MAVMMGRKRRREEGMFDEMDIVKSRHDSF